MNATKTEPLLTPDQVSERLAVSVGTLTVWRCTRRVILPYVKVGRAVRYKCSDIEKFIAARTIEPTAVSA